MSAVTVQEIVEALRFLAGQAQLKEVMVGAIELSKRIEQYGIAPPDGMAVVKDEPVCWAITGDGKFGEIEFGKTFEMLHHSVGYWTGRGYEATPLYAAPEVKP